MNLDIISKPFENAPLYLKFFYRIVDSCDFRWDYETNQNNIWQFANLIKIYSLGVIIPQFANADLLSELQAFYEDVGFV